MSAAGTAILIKAIATALTNKKVWQIIGVLVFSICLPFIICIVVVINLEAGMSWHNNEAIAVAFYDKEIPSSLPKEYEEHLKDMQKAFNKIEKEIEKIEESEDNEEDDEETISLDQTRVKAVFYALFFKEEIIFETKTNENGEKIEIDKVDFESFVNCFADEERMPGIYRNLESELKIDITPEDKANATEIYYRILYGQEVPVYGETFDSWLTSITSSEIGYEGEGEFGSPIENWQDIVTSEYGIRIDPITKKTSAHTGIDFGAVKGTEIYASKSGIVKFVRYKTTGYGYHLAIEHGDGEVTLYAHCSKILVTEGEEVEQGQIVAEVGSTGKSTGNHLHFEIRIGGKTKNPRLYL